MSNIHEDLGNDNRVNAISPPLVYLPDTPLTSITREDFATFAKTLSPELLAESINHCHDQAERNALLAEEPLKRCLEWAFGAGLFLIWAKKTVVKHGDLEQWVRDNCRFNERQAQRYMRLVKKWPEIQAKATSEDAFPKSVNGLLGLVAKEKRRAEAEPDTQANIQGESEEAADADEANKQEKPEPKQRNHAATRTRNRKTQDGDESKKEFYEGEDAEADADETTVEDAHEEEQPEIDPDETTEEAAVYTAQVTGKRSFYVHPESGYDVERVIQHLQNGEAKATDDAVYLGDKEIAWLEFTFSGDELRYFDIRVVLGEPPLEHITEQPTETRTLPIPDPGTEMVALEDGPSETQTQATSLPFDPHFDELPPLNSGEESS